MDDLTRFTDKEIAESGLNRKDRRALTKRRDRERAERRRELRLQTASHLAQTSADGDERDSGGHRATQPTAPSASDND